MLDQIVLLWRLCSFILGKIHKIQPIPILTIRIVGKISNTSVNVIIMLMVSDKWYQKRFLPNHCAPLPMQAKSYKNKTAGKRSQPECTRCGEVPSVQLSPSTSSIRHTFSVFCANERACVCCRTGDVYTTPMYSCRRRRLSLYALVRRHVVDR